VDKPEGYLVIAASLTVSDGFVTVYYGWRVWLANLWVQTIPLSAKPWGGRDV
jgi:hypothetical protein